jgi:hypothetical protein
MQVKVAQLYEDAVGLAPVEQAVQESGVPIAQIWRDGDEHCRGLVGHPSTLDGRVKM